MGFEAGCAGGDAGPSLLWGTGTAALVTLQTSQVTRQLQLQARYVHKTVETVLQPADSTYSGEKTSAMHWQNESEP